MKLFGKITIQPHGSGRWQAFVPLLDTSLADLPGVCGSQNSEGPWIGGTGATPEDALAALRSAIGAVMLAWVAADAPTKGAAK